MSESALHGTDELLYAIDAAYADDWPSGFSDDYAVMECLGESQGCDTFLVLGTSGEQLVAKRYDKAVWNIDPSDDILQKLDHPALPRHVASYEDEGRAVSVRTYIEGSPLDRYARENYLDEQEIARLVASLCDVLAYLHHRPEPIIHRDIKPENVIVRPNGSVALIDFDIARTYRAGNEADTVFFGTRAYAAPEQYGFSQTDSRSDIYSFGVLLRFLLTNSVRVNDKVKVYKPLQKVIDRCTAFAPEKRYRNIDETIRDLRRANPKSQSFLALRTAVVVLLIVATVGLAGFEIFKQVTYSPFKDGSIVPSVMPDEERQADAVKYMQDKFGTHIFDDTSEYMTIGMTRDVLKEVYGMDEAYVNGGNPADPPEESPDWFFPWQLNDEQYIDPDQLEYVVTKVYWPDVVTDWTVLKEDPGMYPGCYLAEKWCEDHDIMLGVNRPEELSRGEAAIAFANADRVYEAMKEMEKE